MLGSGRDKGGVWTVFCVSPSVLHVHRAPFLPIRPLGSISVVLAVPFTRSTPSSAFRVPWALLLVDALGRCAASGRPSPFPGSLRHSRADSARVAAGIHQGCGSRGRRARDRRLRIRWGTRRAPVGIRWRGPIRCHVRTAFRSREGIFLRQGRHPGRRGIELHPFVFRGPRCEGSRPQEERATRTQGQGQSGRERPQGLDWHLRRGAVARCGSDRAERQASAVSSPGARPTGCPLQCSFPSPSRAWTGVRRPGGPDPCWRRVGEAR